MHNLFYNLVTQAHCLHCQNNAPTPPCQSQHCLTKGNAVLVMCPDKREPLWDLLDWNEYLDYADRLVTRATGFYHYCLH